MNPTRLRQQLEASFTLEELKTLTFDLGINFDNLAGDTLMVKTRELVNYALRRGLEDELLEKCRQERPQIDWGAETEPGVDGELGEETAADDPLRRLIELVKTYNRNRHQSYSEARTEEGDAIASDMREMAPSLYGRLDPGQWLNSRDPGKRIAAVKYIDWSQDIAYLEQLLDMLEKERGITQFHILLTFDRLLDQFDYYDQKLLIERLELYKPRKHGSREQRKQLLLKKIGTPRP